MHLHTCNMFRKARVHTPMNRPRAHLHLTQTLMRAEYVWMLASMPRLHRATQQAARGFNTLQACERKRRKATCACNQRMHMVAYTAHAHDQTGWHESSCCSCCLLAHLRISPTSSSARRSCWWLPHCRQHKVAWQPRVSWSP